MPTVSEFYEDFPGFGGIYATLDEHGVMELVIRLEKSAPIKGHQLFSRAVENFASELKVIRGHWTWSVNLERVNELTATGSSLENAVMLTWTARQAFSHGYTNTEVIGSAGVAGAYTAIHVDFARPRNK
jgi:hypothetical protein